VRSHARRGRDGDGFLSMEEWLRAMQKAGGLTIGKKHLSEIDRATAVVSEEEAARICSFFVRARARRAHARRAHAPPRRAPRVARPHRVAARAWGDGPSHRSVSVIACAGLWPQDRDGDGFISYSEFMRFLQGSALHAMRDD